MKFYPDTQSTMTSANKPLLFAVGGAHLDRRGQSMVPFVPGASNPGIMREEPGGGVFNALRLVVQRGVAAEILSVRGGDRIGELIGDAIQKAGIKDGSAVYMDRATPSYTAILDEHGDVVAGIADMELYEVALPRQLLRRKVREFDRRRRCRLLRCQPAFGCAAAAGRAGRRSAAVRAGDFAGQGRTAAADLRQPLLPVHEPARSTGTDGPWAGCAAARHLCGVARSGPARRCRQQWR